MPKYDGTDDDYQGVAGLGPDDDDYQGDDDDYQGVAGLGPAPSICDCCEPGLVGQHPDCVKALWEVLIMMMVMIKIMIIMTMAIVIVTMVDYR